MRKLTSIIIGAALLCGIAHAQSFTDLSAKEYGGKTGIKKAHAAIDANFATIEAGTAPGATALSVTNAQAVTVAAATYIISGIGGADNTTNTVTLVAPTVAGQKVTFIAATATSNLIAIADSGTVAASGGIELDGNDTAVLQAVDTSTWALISESDN